MHQNVIKEFQTTCMPYVPKLERRPFVILLEHLLSMFAQPWRFLILQPQEEIKGKLCQQHAGRPLCVAVAQLVAMACLPICLLRSKSILLRLLSVRPG